MNWIKPFRRLRHLSCFVCKEDMLILKYETIIQFENMHGADTHTNIGKCGTLIDFMVEVIANKLNMELKIEKNRAEHISLVFYVMERRKNECSRKN